MVSVIVALLIAVKQMHWLKAEIRRRELKMDWLLMVQLLEEDRMVWVEVLMTSSMLVDEIFFWGQHLDQEWLVEQDELVEQV